MNRVHPKLHLRVMQARKNYGIDTDDSPYRDAHLCRLETTLHELAHCFTLRLKLSEHTSNAISFRMRRMSHRGSDESEMWACAVELRAAELLAHPLNPVSLAKFSSGNMKYYDYEDRPAACLRGIQKMSKRPSTERIARRIVRLLLGL